MIKIISIFNENSIEWYVPIKSKASAWKLKLENNEKWILILAAFRMIYNKTMKKYRHSNLQRSSILCPSETT